MNRSHGSYGIEIEHITLHSIQLYIIEIGFFIYATRISGDTSRVRWRNHSEIRDILLV